MPRAQPRGIPTSCVWRGARAGGRGAQGAAATAGFAGVVQRVVAGTESVTSLTRMPTRPEISPSDGSLRSIGRAWWSVTEMVMGSVTGSGLIARSARGRAAGRQVAVGAGRGARWRGAPRAGAAGERRACRRGRGPSASRHGPGRRARARRGRRSRRSRRCGAGSAGRRAVGADERVVAAAADAAVARVVDDVAWRRPGQSPGPRRARRRRSPREECCDGQPHAQACAPHVNHGAPSRRAVHAGRGGYGITVG